MFQRHAYDADRIRTTFETYRYDALGRRILVRSQHDTASCGETETDSDAKCVRSIQRFVWDGDQLLYEIRAPGGWQKGDTSVFLENDSPSGIFVGRVHSMHGLGIDLNRPVFSGELVR